MYLVNLTIDSVFKPCVDSDKQPVCLLPSILFMFLKLRLRFLLVFSRCCVYDCCQSTETRIQLLSSLFLLVFITPLLAFQSVSLQRLVMFMKFHLIKKTSINCYQFCISATVTASLSLPVLFHLLSSIYMDCRSDFCLGAYYFSCYVTPF